MTDRARKRPVQKGSKDQPAGIVAIADRKQRIRRQLLKWYDDHHRDLPWRQREHDPYAQMVAELMLQQTQVDRVIEYFNQFIQRFPTVADLANADESEVLSYWSGLGYYRRARHLHAAAGKVVTEFAGQFPSQVDALMTLPGIGRYTAGAIASIAFDQRVPILDGNVARVLMRLAALDADPQATAVQHQLWTLAETLLPARRVGHFNQALMELGAMCCTPVAPTCHACPLRNCCQARQLNLVDGIPRPRQRARIRELTWAVAVIECRDALLFAQRPADGLWANLWDFPHEPVGADESPRQARDRLRRRLQLRCRLSTSPIGFVERQLTHRRIRMHVYRGQAAAELSASTTPIAAKAEWKWLTRDEIKDFGISQACKAIIALLDR